MYIGLDRERTDSLDKIKAAIDYLEKQGYTVIKEDTKEAKVIDEVLMTQEQVDDIYNKIVSKW
jgi:hypothetical protein